jgi:hypothetical protein
VEWSKEKEKRVGLSNGRRLLRCCGCMRCHSIRGGVMGHVKVEESIPFFILMMIFFFQISLLHLITGTKTIKIKETRP